MRERKGQYILSLQRPPDFDIGFNSRKVENAGGGGDKVILPQNQESSNLLAKIG